MNNINPLWLYINSYLHYGDKKEIKIDDVPHTLYIYYLDKRFVIEKDVDIIKRGFAYCNVKDIDKYWYKIISSYPLNNYSIFYKLLENSIIYNINYFNKIIRSSK